MSIQLSIVIWTAICFSLTALILRAWVFRPVHKVLDQRRRALEEAREKKDEYEKLKQENENRLKEQRAQYLEARKEEIRNKTAQMEADSKTRLKEAQRACGKDIESYRQKLQDDYERIVGTISLRMEPAAKTIAEKIISYRS